MISAPYWLATHANQHALGFQVLHPTQVAEDFFLAPSHAPNRC
jgi:hypothetical protein